MNDSAVDGNATESLPRELVSDVVVAVLETLINTWLCPLVSVTGIVTNAIVISTYKKQGFKDSIIVSLTAISCLDFTICLTGLAQRLYGIVDYFDPPLAISWNKITAVSLFFVNNFSEISSGCLASYVAIERTVCVCLPFDVKLLFTPKQALFVMLSICSIVFGSTMIAMFSFEIYPMFSPKYNTTIWIYGFSDLFLAHEDIITRYYDTMGMFWPSACFVTILMCSVIIIFKLKQAKRFNRADKTTGGRQQITRNETRVTKMLLVVITVYLVAIVPKLISYTLRQISHDFYIGGSQDNVFWISTYFQVLLNLVNASVNFFIYLKMSTSFRVTLMSMLRLKSSGLESYRDSVRVSGNRRSTEKH